MLPVRLLTITLGIVLSLTATARAADAPVSLELATEAGFPIDGQQAWMRLLQERQFDLRIRIRSARTGEQPNIENRGSESSPRYVVTGTLTSDGKLVVPGLVMRINQRAELAAWLAKLRGGGIEAVTAPTGAFGLTARQLGSLQEAVRNRVSTATKGRPVRDVLREIERSIRLTVEWDPSAEQALKSDAQVLDELQGISCGTALSAALRPYGLLVTPTGQGTRTVGLRITRTAKVEEAWPVGAAIQGGAMDRAPQLLEYINVEIVDQPLDTTLATIQQRLKLPFLYDHNALARHNIDLSEKVNLERTRTFYKKILDLLLIQKLVRCELRQDDAGTPFLWITSSKR